MKKQDDNNNTNLLPQYIELKGNISEILVGDIMTRALVSVEPSTTIYQVAKMMEQGGFGAIIVKENGLPK